MNRYLFALTVVACTTNVRADDRTPEELLPPTMQVYARWDGIAAHQQAYDESARGKMFAGETGKAFDGLWERLRRELKLTQVGEPLLEGQPPEELKKTLTDLKAVLGLPKLLAQTGIVAGFEIRPAGLDLATLSKLISGNPEVREEVMQPQFLLTFIIPGAAEKSELSAALRLLIKSGSKERVKERTIDGRKIVSLEEEREGWMLCAWAEGKHFVVAVSNLNVEKVVAKIKNAGPGVTSHPLYKKLAGFKEFRVVTRGFVDVGNMVLSFANLIKAYAPAAWPILEASGIPGIKSVCFWDGFEGEYSRGVIEIDVPGSRQGLTRIFKPAAFKPADLPPLPADLTRFVAARMDLNNIYESVALGVNYYFDRTDDADKTLKPEEQFRQRKEKLLRAVDEEVGFKMAELFTALGDKIVTYQAPTDGLLNVGQVVAISVNDEKALRRCLDSLGRKLTSTAREKLVIKKRDCLGVEVREFVIAETSPVTISCAICEGWLVIGFQPQPMRGFIYRCKGKLPVWKPDARTAATLAKVQADRCVIQVADPRTTLNWLYGAAPIIAGLTGRNGREPIVEAGLLPHAGEASQHLFPNVMWCRDDGKVMRWESRDSLWLPLEFVGMEMIGVYLGAAGGLFF